MSIIGQGSPECKYCGMEESNIHFVYQCIVYKPVMEWFKMLILKCCNFNPNMIKELMLDIPNVEKTEKKYMCNISCNIYNKYMDSQES